ncbi:hypothetical protein D3C72_1919840 [compost metagenome]
MAFFYLIGEDEEDPKFIDDLYQLDTCSKHRCDFNCYFYGSSAFDADDYIIISREADLCLDLALRKD